MEINKERKLFIGLKIGGRLREALDNASKDQKMYFDDPESPYLQILMAGEERWLGKLIEPGLKVQQAEDLQNNVVSILRRIAPDVRHNASTLTIFALDDPSEKVVAPPPPEPPPRDPYRF